MGNRFEDQVKSCYSTWGTSYYDDYYGEKASYPPVHVELLKDVLAGSGARTVLDAGCGPASFLRHLDPDKVDLHGFDLTPEMVIEGRRILGAMGVPEEHVWEGSVLQPACFRPPSGRPPHEFDAAICVGVLPHVPEEHDLTVIRNLRGAVKKGGLVVVEARNQFFSMFTLNRYSYDFFANDLIQVSQLRERAGATAGELDESLETLRQRFRMDLPPVRKGKAGEPGYDEVVSRTHNPLVLQQQFVESGFERVEILFYHYHCLPPMLQARVPALFRQQSLDMERPRDWRGYFMASAFLVAGRRP